MTKSNEEIEHGLKELLSECLESANQESGIKSVKYSPESQEFYVTMDVMEIDGEYMFQGY